MNIPVINAVVNSKKLSLMTLPRFAPNAAQMKPGNLCRAAPATETAMAAITACRPAVAAQAVPAATAHLVDIKYMRSHLVIATRGSKLALWQAEYVKSLLQGVDPSVNVSINVIKTKGDIIQNRPLAKIGGKGLFVKEIEDALLDGRADLAVHSVKDMPMELPEGLILGCVPQRQAVTDSYVSYKYPAFQLLPQNARVGTSSLRRQAQLLAKRPDLRIESLRGNVDTRLKKIENGDFDATILATAGMNRLGLDAPFVQPLDADDFLPAAGQGALGIECHEDNYDLFVLLAHLENREARLCVDAERSFVRALNGNCQAPVAARGHLVDEEMLELEGLVAEPDGSMVLRAKHIAPAEDATQLGILVADEIKNNGGDAIIERLINS